MKKPDPARPHEIQECVVDAAEKYHRVLCEQALLYRAIYYGVGTMEAHAANNSLEEWIAAWGRVR